MFAKRLLYALAVVLAIAVIACNAIKKNDPEEEIRAFVVSFQTSLDKPDTEILKLFEAQQSHEAILSAIRVLQNKESKYVSCIADYPNAKIQYEEGNILVNIPAVFTTEKIGDEEALHSESILTLVLKKKQQGLAIQQLQGEEFYRVFSNLRGRIEWRAERQEALKTRQPFFAQAQKLQQQYDSVVWYTTYKGTSYFYVVNGSWGPSGDVYNPVVNLTTATHKMGLVDGAGTVIIPVEYQLIGTLGFIRPDLVEVVKDKKVGHFDLTTRTLVVNPAYDILIPYAAENTYALTQTDSTHGWIDKQFQYHEGFPSTAAEQYVNEFLFLPDNLTLDNKHYTLCEIPNEKNAGWGMIIPPSYFVKLGLFQQVIAGIASSDMPYEGWKDYVQTNGTLLQQVTDGIRALVTRIQEDYTQGREEFYVSNRVAFIAPDNDTLHVAELSGEHVSNLRHIRENLIEIVSNPHEYFEYEGDGETEYDIPTYTYFTVDETGVKKANTTRIFSFTEFATLDSSYVVGDFHRWDPETGDHIPMATLSMKTLQLMRNEILASYGLQLPDSLTRQFKNYHPETGDIEVVRNKFTEIDRHNVDFLETFMKLLTTTDVPPANKPI